MKHLKLKPKKIIRIGKTDVEEDFAESFRFYVYDKLEGERLKFMEGNMKYIYYKDKKVI